MAGFYVRSKVTNNTLSILLPVCKHLYLASPPGPLLILVLEGLVREVLAHRTFIEPI